MEKSLFFNELRDILESDDENLNENSPIMLTSLSILSVMAFVYENFDKQVKPLELHKIQYVRDLISLIGDVNLT